MVLEPPSHVPDDDFFLATVTSRLRKTFHADFAFAGRVAPRTGLVTIGCADGARTGHYLGKSAAPRDQGIGGQVIAVGRHVLVAAGGRSARFQDGGTALAECQENVRSVLAVPLRVDGRVAFVLYLALRSRKSIDEAATNAALSFVRQAEFVLAQA